MKVRRPLYAYGLMADTNFPGAAVRAVGGGSGVAVGGSGRGSTSCWQLLLRTASAADQTEMAGFTWK